MAKDQTTEPKPETTPAPAPEVQAPPPAPAPVETPVVNHSASSSDVMLVQSARDPNRKPKNVMTLNDGTIRKDH